VHCSRGLIHGYRSPTWLSLLPTKSRGSIQNKQHAAIWHTIFACVIKKRDSSNEITVDTESPWTAQGEEESDWAPSSGGPRRMKAAHFAPSRRRFRPPIYDRQYRDQCQQRICISAPRRRHRRVRLFATSARSVLHKCPTARAPGSTCPPAQAASP
jgi:hypothetical protein